MNQRRARIVGLGDSGGRFFELVTLALEVQHRAAVHEPVKNGGGYCRVIVGHPSLSTTLSAFWRLSFSALTAVMLWTKTRAG